MATYRVPVTAATQTFKISLAGVFYQILLQWCDPSRCWILSFSNSQGSPLLSSIPLVTGVDLLSPHQHLGIKGSLVVQTDNNPDEVPDLNTLGSTGNLYFIVPD